MEWQYGSWELSPGPARAMGVECPTLPPHITHPICSTLITAEVNLGAKL
jgi:hypothetical protein